MDDDLLNPSLEAAPTQPVYSVGAMIGAAFFGGSFAVPLLALENSRRLRRLAKDAVWIVLALAAATALLLWVLASTSSQPEDWGRSVRLWNRGGGFLLVGAFYLLHQRAYRTMRHTGTEHPKPYGAVIAVTLAGIAITLGLVQAVRSGAIPLPAL